MELRQVTLPYKETNFIKIIKPNLKRGPWIAGGSVRLMYENRYDQLEATAGVNIHDIDVYCKNQAQFDKVVKQITQMQPTRATVDIFTENPFSMKFGKVDRRANRFYVTENANTENAITYTITSQDTDVQCKIQLIKIFKDSVEDIFDSFDIRLCKGVTDGSTILFAPGAQHDIETRTLTFTKYNPENILRRYIKYTSYGFVDRDNIIERMNNDDTITDTGGNDYDAVK